MYTHGQHAAPLKTPGGGGHATDKNYPNPKSMVNTFQLLCISRYRARWLSSALSFSPEGARKDQRLVFCLGSHRSLPHPAPRSLADLGSSTAALLHPAVPRCSLLWSRRCPPGLAQGAGTGRRELAPSSISPRQQHGAGPTLTWAVCRLLGCHLHEKSDLLALGERVACPDS